MIRNKSSYSRKNLFAFLVVIAISIFAGHAYASQCVMGQVKEVGFWTNPDSNTTGITRAVFTEECRDNPTRTCNGNVCTTTSGVKLVYSAHLWASCSPYDCYWGKVDGSYFNISWLGLKGLYFTYDQGYAKRSVHAQIWSGGDNWLRLTVNTDFVNSSRADYSWAAWMQKPY